MKTFIYDFFLFFFFFSPNNFRTQTRFSTTENVETGASFRCTSTNNTTAKFIIIMVFYFFLPSHFPTIVFSMFLILRVKGLLHVQLIIFVINADASKTIWKVTAWLKWNLYIKTFFSRFETCNCYKWDCHNCLYIFLLFSFTISRSLFTFLYNDSLKFNKVYKKKKIYVFLSLNGIVALFYFIFLSFSPSVFVYDGSLNFGEIAWQASWGPSGFQSASHSDYIPNLYLQVSVCIVLRNLLVRCAPQSSKLNTHMQVKSHRKHETPPWNFIRWQLYISHNRNPEMREKQLKPLYSLILYILSSIFLFSFIFPTHRFPVIFSFFFFLHFSVLFWMVFFFFFFNREGTVLCVTGERKSNKLPTRLGITCADGDSNVTRGK